MCLQLGLFPRARQAEAGRASLIAPLKPLYMNHAVAQQPVLAVAHHQHCKRAAKANFIVAHVLQLTLCIMLPRTCRYSNANTSDQRILLPRPSDQSPDRSSLISLAGHKELSESSRVQCHATGTVSQGHLQLYRKQYDSHIYHAWA